MSWLDDLKTRAEQSVSTAGKNITDYLGSMAIEPTVTSGNPSGGNQTAAQIAAGQFGHPPGVAAPQAAPATIANAQSASMFSSAAVTSMLPLIALGIGAYFLLGKSRRG